MRDKTVPQLLKIATRHFNEYIRLRDSEDGLGACISCGRRLKVPSVNSQAGHFYPAGNVGPLRFNEDNVHLQCKSCNYFKSGDLLNYRRNLLEKIGEKRVDKLDMTAAIAKRSSYKWNRFHLIEIIETYKLKKKELK